MTDEEDRGASPSTLRICAVVVAIMCPLIASLLLGAAPAAHAASAGARQEVPAAEVVQAVKEQLLASHVPAAAVAVVERGAVSIGTVGDGISASTPFVLGSMSKSFTAIAVLQLHDAGLVDLDAPVGSYLPEFAGSAAGEGQQDDEHARITTRQLLTQTSGLPTSAGLTLIDHPSMSLPERGEAAARTPLASPPGEAFHYSNANYAVLGRLVEVVSGQGFGDYVQERIFDSLGMTSSRTSLASAGRDGLPSAHTVWFGLSFPRATPDYPGGSPDGFLVSAATDMATYLTFQLGDGTWRGERVLSTASMQLMHAAAVPTEPDTAAAGTDSYAMGWGVGSVDEQPLLAHDGDVIGYHAEMALLPASSSALVVLTARNGALTDARAPFARGLAALAGGALPPISGAFTTTYVIVDVTCAAVVFILAWWLVRPRWRRRLFEQAAKAGPLRAGTLPMAGYLATAGALYASVFWGLGVLTVGEPMSLRFAAGFVAPDLTALVLTVCGALVVRAVWTALALWRTARAARRGAASGVQGPALGAA
ncbi:serine hydrolase domain-containing protein [Quadrisphaera granulorum]|uniref:serine hydrolase domain-containing protein n=1 Tax=Quadrisphaera granulorum TaxID=317664 RepID=UPI000D6B33A1|nr:serine hydrolase domain-containing protein [Quadrisphaera granulorum]